MQSVFQYRRFGRHVRDQYERDKKRTEALNRGNAENKNEETGFDRQYNDPSTESVPSTQSHDSRDPEKGEQLGSPNDREQEGNTQRNGILEPEPLERRATITTTKTNQSFGTRMGHALSGIEVRQLDGRVTRTKSRASKSKPTKTKDNRRKEMDTVFVVGYESEKDNMNPHNWPFATRVRATITIACIGFIVGFASSIDSAALPQAAAEFGVSEVAEALATGLFLVGFGCGGLCSGPISETVGRNPVYIVTMFTYMIWLMAAGLAPNLGSQLVFRFLAGFFGATPLACAGGSVSDLWDPLERVYAFPIFANLAFMGPIIGPVVGGFIGQSSLVSWRWCEWITLIISGLILGVVVLFQPETYAPILLKWKASHLRELTGDDRFVAEVEIRADSFWKRLLHSLYRPFLLTVREPIVILFSLYLTVVYIILFTFLDGYTNIFGDTYGFSEGLTGLAFVAIALGLCVATILVPFIYRWAKRDLHALRLKDGPNAKLPPEKRLLFAMFGAPAMPISLFWMGWTNYPSISPWSGLVASVMFGYGVLCIFISSYQYLIDAYEMYAASALASLTFVRYVAAGGMVEVGIPFYQNMGVHWTLTILGAISTLMVPVPFVFYWYGLKIRSWSKYAAN